MFKNYFVYPRRFNLSKLNSFIKVLHLHANTVRSPTGTTVKQAEKQNHLNMSCNEIFPQRGRKAVWLRMQKPNTKHTAETFNATVKKVYAHLLEKCLSRLRPMNRSFTGQRLHSAHDIVTTRQELMGLINILTIPETTFLRKLSSGSLEFLYKKKRNKVNRREKIYSKH